MYNKNNNNSGFFFKPFFTDLFDTPISNTDLKIIDRNMRTDVVETEGEYLLSVDLPGFKKDQVSVEIEDGYLVISAQAETSNDGEIKGEPKYLRRERSSKSLKRSFYVGDDVNEESIEAKMEDGVLSITLPKKTPVVPPKKTINIQ